MSSRDKEKTMPLSPGGVKDKDWAEKVDKAKRARAAAAKVRQGKPGTFTNRRAHT